MMEQLSMQENLGFVAFHAVPSKRNKINLGSLLKLIINNMNKGTCKMCKENIII